MLGRKFINPRTKFQKKQNEIIRKSDEYAKKINQQVKQWFKDTDHAIDNGLELPQPSIHLKAHIKIHNDHREAEEFARDLINSVLKNLVNQAVGGGGGLFLGPGAPPPPPKLQTKIKFFDKLQKQIDRWKGPIEQHLKNFKESNQEWLKENDKEYKKKFEERVKKEEQQQKEHKEKQEKEHRERQEREHRERQEREQREKQEREHRERQEREHRERQEREEREKKFKEQKEQEKREEKFKEQKEQELREKKFKEQKEQEQKQKEEQIKLQKEQQEKKQKEYQERRERRDKLNKEYETRLKEQQRIEAKRTEAHPHWIERIKKAYPRTKIQPPSPSPSIPPSTAPSTPKQQPKQQPKTAPFKPKPDKDWIKPKTPPQKPVPPKEPPKLPPPKRKQSQQEQREEPMKRVKQERGTADTIMQSGEGGMPGGGANPENDVEEFEIPGHPKEHNFTFTFSRTVKYIQTSQFEDVIGFGDTLIQNLFGAGLPGIISNESGWGYIPMNDTCLYMSPNEFYQIMLMVGMRGSWRPKHTSVELLSTILTLNVPTLDGSLQSTQNILFKTYEDHSNILFGHTTVFNGEGGRQPLSYPCANALLRNAAHIDIHNLNPTPFPTYYHSFQKITAPPPPDNAVQSYSLCLESRPGIQYHPIGSVAQWQHSYDQPFRAINSPTSISAGTNINNATMPTLQSNQGLWLSAPLGYGNSEYYTQRYRLGTPGTNLQTFTNQRVTDYDAGPRTVLISLPTLNQTGGALGISGIMTCYLKYEITIEIEKSWMEMKYLPTRPGFQGTTYKIFADSTIDDEIVSVALKNNMSQIINLNEIGYGNIQ